MKFNRERWDEEYPGQRIRQIVRWIIAIGLICCLTIPIIGVFIMVLGVILIAPDIAGWLSIPAGNFLWPGHNTPERKPAYSAAEAHTINGRFAEAEQEYEQIISDFPDEIRPHTALIIIAIVELYDLERAEEYYRRGLEMLKDPAAREELTQAYQHYLKNAGRYVRIPPRHPRANDTACAPDP